MPKRTRPPWRNTTLNIFLWSLWEWQQVSDTSKEDAKQTPNTRVQANLNRASAIALVPACNRPQKLRTIAHVVLRELGHCAVEIVMRQRATLQRHMVDNVTTSRNWSLASALPRDGHLHAELQSLIDFKLRDQLTSTGVNMFENDDKLSSAMTVFYTPESTLATMSDDHGVLHSLKGQCSVRNIICKNTRLATWPLQFRILRYTRIQWCAHRLY